MFRLISRREFVQLQALGERFLNTHQNASAGLLCLDHAFSQPPKFNAVKAPELVPVLQAYGAYCRVLQRAAFDIDPCHNLSLQRLLAFQPSADSEGTFSLRQRSFLHGLELQRRRDPSLESQPVEMSAWDLSNLIHSSLRERLKRRVTNEDVLISMAPAIAPCLTMVMFGTCNSTNCSKSHWDQTIDPDNYHLRIRLLFQQILIYQTATPVEHRNAVAKQRRWIPPSNCVMILY